MSSLSIAYRTERETRSCRANTWPQVDKTSRHTSPGSPGDTVLQPPITTNSVFTQEVSVNSPDAAIVPGGRIKSTEVRADQKSRYSVPLGSTLSFELLTCWESSDPPPSGLSRAGRSQRDATQRLTPEEHPGDQEDLQDGVSAAEEADHQRDVPTAPPKETSHRRDAEDKLLIHQSISDVHAPSEQHSCFSANTKIFDLKGHIYVSPRQQRANSSGPRGRAGRVVVCSEEGCCICSDGAAARSAAGQEASRGASEGVSAVCPARWQFEEAEDELEDIWSAAGRERAP